MRQRIVSGLQWLVALTAMLISGAVFWQQSQLLVELRQARQEEAAQRQALTAKLDHLQPPSVTYGPPVGPGPDQVFSPPTYETAAAGVLPESGPVPLGSTSPSAIPTPDAPLDRSSPLPDNGPPLLALTFVQESEDGPPVCPRSVELTDSENVVHPGTILNNNVAYSSLQPDFYQLSVALVDGQHSERPLLIRENKPRELIIVCPGPLKKTPVSIAIKPLSDDLQKRQIEARLTVWAAPVEIGQANWTTPILTSQTIKFDSQTGLPTSIDVGRSGSHFNLRDLPPDERRVFLPVGVVHYQFEAPQRLVGPDPVRLYEWPESQLEEPVLRHTVKPDESTWELELPKEFLEQIRNFIDQARPLSVQ